MELCGRPPMAIPYPKHIHQSSPQHQPHIEYKANPTNLLTLAAIATTYVTDDQPRLRRPSAASESGDETDTSTVHYSDSPSPPPSLTHGSTTLHHVMPPPRMYMPTQAMGLPEHMTAATHIVSSAPCPQSMAQPQHPQHYIVISGPQQEVFYGRKPVVMASSTVATESTVSAEEVNRWMKYAPVGNQKLWKCLKCKRDYKTKYVCKRHVEAHLVHKPYGCQNCNRRFQRLDQLQRHRKKILKCKPARLCRLSTTPQQLQPQPIPMPGSHQ